MTQLPRVARSAVAGCLLLAIGFVEPAAVQPQGTRYLADTGPLRIRDQFLLGLGYLSFDPVSASLVESGKWQFDVILTVSNHFAHSQSVDNALEGASSRRTWSLQDLQQVSSGPPGEGEFLVDGEHYRSALAIRRGINDRMHLEVVVPVISIQGGFLDSAIEGFHDTFSFGQAGRLGVPRDSFLIYVGAKDQLFFLDSDPSVALGDIVFGAKIDLRPDAVLSSSKLALEALVKTPTGQDEQLTGSGSLDLGVQLLATRYFAKACVHASLGAAFLGPRNSLGLSSQTVFSGMVAYERSVRTKNSLLLQLTVSQSPFGDLDLQALEEVSTQVTLGYKRAIQQRVLFLGITENVGSFNNSPDIGFHVGLTWGL